jgi:LysR family transcriptional regulator, mexEF-oprN operon transcriptional activator
MLSRTDACTPSVPATLSQGSLTRTGQGKNRHFNAYTSQTTFHIGVSSDVEYALLPALLNRLRIEAPDVTLSTVQADPQQLPALLSSGEISLGIGPLPSAALWLNRHLLRTLRPHVLRADRVPGPLCLEDFCRRLHVSVSFAQHIDRHVDECLDSLGQRRRVITTVSQFNSLPTLLKHTDLLALVPDYVATEMVKKGGLRAEVLPMPSLAFELSMVWSHALASDPAQQWLRSRCILLLGTQPD